MAPTAHPWGNKTKEKHRCMLFEQCIMKSYLLSFLISLKVFKEGGKAKGGSRSPKDLLLIGRSAPPIKSYTRGTP